MKRIAIIVAISMLITACGPTPVSIPTPDIQATTAAIVSQMIKTTQEAQLSATLAPTNTSLPTATMTDPPPDTPTPEQVVATITASVDPLMGLATSTPWFGTLSPGNTEGLPTGFLRIENNTGVKEIIVTLTGVTLKRDQPVYYAYKVNGALVLTILWARYQYVVQVPNKRVFTGSFSQASKDKTILRVNPTVVNIIGP